MSWRRLFTSLGFVILFMLMSGCSDEYESLVSQLESEHWQTRLEAVRELGELGDKRAVDLLIPLMWVERGKTVGAAAIVALGKLGDARAVEPLVEALGDFYLGGDAQKALAEFETDTVIEPLIQAVESDGASRWRAATALGELGDARAIEPLIEMMRIEALRMMEGSGPNQQIVAGALRAGGEALAKIDGGTKAFLVFSEEMISDDEQIIISAVSKLGCLQTREALADALSDGALEVRIAAAIALIDGHADDAAEDLQTILDGEGLPVATHPQILKYFIGRGIPGSEEVLIKALWHHGTKFTAQTFLNCGNEELAKAGELWANRHGYSILQGYAGGGPRWGSR